MKYCFNIPSEVSSKPFISWNLFIAILETSWLSRLTTNHYWKAALQWNYLNFAIHELCFFFSGLTTADTLIYGFFFWSWNQIKFTVVCLNISFSKNLWHVETIQLICIETQLTGLYMTWAFTEIDFRKEFNFKCIDCSFLIIMKDSLVNFNVLLNVCLMLWT